jgi:hypothetical protein
MTRDDLYKSFLEDPLFKEKGILTEERASRLPFGDYSGNNLIEIIKLAISGTVDRESENITSRKILQYLTQNKKP